jgi:hypothetical protein
MSTQEFQSYIASSKRSADGNATQQPSSKRKKVEAKRVAAGQDIQREWMKAMPTHFTKINENDIRVEIYERRHDKKARIAKETKRCAETGLKLQEDVVKERKRLDALRKLHKPGDPEYPDYSEYPKNGVFEPRILNFALRIGPAGSRGNPYLTVTSQFLEVSNAGARFDPLGCNKDAPRAHLIKNNKFPGNNRTISCRLNVPIGEPFDDETSYEDMYRDLVGAIHEKITEACLNSFDFTEEYYTEERESRDDEGTEYTEAMLRKKLARSKTLWPKDICPENKNVDFLNLKQRCFSNPDYVDMKDRSPPSDTAHKVIYDAYYNPKNKPMVLNPRLVYLVGERDEKTGEMVLMADPVIDSGYQISSTHAIQITRNPKDKDRFGLRNEIKMIYLLKTSSSAIASSLDQMEQERSHVPIFDCAVSRADAANDMKISDEQLNDAAAFPSNEPVQMVE